jgi:uncharacterized membrane protein
MGHTGLSAEDHARLIAEKRAAFLAVKAEYERLPKERKDAAEGRALAVECDRLYGQMLTLMSQSGGIVSPGDARVRHWEMFFERYWILKFSGFLVAVIFVYFLGFFFATYLGRGMWRLIEAAMKRIPVVRQIYPYVKQITDFVLSEQKVEFRRVVAVQYPRRGIWSLGFVTGPGLRTVKEATALDLVTVFIPSSPTPVTGYVVLVRRQDIIDVPIGVDSALRFAVSGGVIMPPGEVPPQLEGPAIVDADPETVTLEAHPPRRPPAGGGTPDEPESPEQEG